jgi:hypothetical protein
MLRTWRHLGVVNNRREKLPPFARLDFLKVNDKQRSRNNLGTTDPLITAADRLHQWQSRHKPKNQKLKLQRCPTIWILCHLT